MATQRPVHTIRRGKLEAAIWENQSTNGRFFRITFRRSYRADDGKLASSDSFSSLELAHLALLVIQAGAWVQANEPKTKDTTREAGEVGHE